MPDGNTLCSAPLRAYIPDLDNGCRDGAYRCVIALADVINSRFRNGHPTSDLSSAGVLFHIFDQGETTAVTAYGGGATEAPPWAYEPWLPCPDSMWCATYNDRVSASLLNKRIVQAGGSGLSLFGGVGVVYAPELTEIWCSFIGDGGTMHPDPNHGCGSSWCDPDAAQNDHQCPWRPKDLSHMLAGFESAPYGYNEVLVATPNWTEKLPELIEAIFWVDQGSEAEARGVHAGFMKRYPHAAPRLLKMDLSQPDAPFSEHSVS